MTDSSDPRLWWIVILRDCSITGSREGKKIWIQIPFCLNCDLDFAGLLVPSFARTCIFVFVAEFCIFLNLCFPLIFVHFLGFVYFLYCLWWIVIWIVLVAPPLARDGGKNREKKPFWWQSRCLSPSCSYRTLYADRVNVTKWGKKEDVMMMILLRAVLFGESISVPFPPCQGCVRWRCLHCISNTFRNIIKGESRLQAICEEGKCFFFSMASKQPTLLEPPPCFCSSVLMLYFAKSRLADVGISH